MDALTDRINTAQQLAGMPERKLKIIVELIVPWPLHMNRSAVVSEVYDKMEMGKQPAWIVDTVKAVVGVV